MQIGGEVPQSVRLALEKEKARRDEIRVALVRIGETRDWNLVVSLMQEFVDDMRRRNEDHQLPHEDRLFLLGQLKALEWLQDLPRVIGELASRQEETDPQDGYTEH